jgi:hypothetical protein
MSLDLEDPAHRVGLHGPTESVVLAAMGYPDEEARGATAAVARPDNHRRRDRDGLRGRPAVLASMRLGAMP